MSNCVVLKNGNNLNIKGYPKVNYLGYYVMHFVKQSRGSIAAKAN